MADPQRILIIRPSALGDVCRSVPVLVSLRNRYPKAQIDWVVQECFAEAVVAHPALDSVIAFPRKCFARWWRNLKVAGQMLRWFDHLRKRHYDLVFDMQGLGRSGLIAAATRAERRVGFRSAREFGWLGCNVRHEIPKNLHTVDEMLALLQAEQIEPVRDMRLYLSEKDRKWWQQQRASENLTDTNYAVLAPTSRWPSKRWPGPRWASLADALIERGIERIISIGGPNEAEQVQRAMPEKTDEIINLCGRTTIGRTMAIIADASLVVANDSAPLHMAVGFGRLCIGLYGPTNPATVGPYQHSEAVVTAKETPDKSAAHFKDSRLGDYLMKTITVEDVLERLDHLMGNTATDVNSNKPQHETFSRK